MLGNIVSLTCRITRELAFYADVRGVGSTTLENALDRLCLKWFAKHKFVGLFVCLLAKG